MSNATDEALADVRAHQEEAERISRLHRYDADILREHYARYQFGSLANNWEAADMRRKYWHAYLLAMKRQRAAS